MLSINRIVIITHNVNNLFPGKVMYNGENKTSIDITIKFDTYINIY